MQVRQNVDDDDLNDDGHNAWSRSTTVPDGGRVRVPLNLMDSVQEQIFYASRPGYRTMSDAGWDDDYAKARRLADQSRADYIRQITAGRQANSPNGGPLSDDDVDRIVGLVESIGSRERIGHLAGYACRVRLTGEGLDRPRPPQVRQLAIILRPKHHLADFAKIVAECIFGVGGAAAISKEQGVANRCGG